VVLAGIKPRMRRHYPARDANQGGTGPWKFAAFSTQYCRGNFLNPAGHYSNHSGNRDMSKIRSLGKQGVTDSALTRPNNFSFE
jgi:hypothetical protein